MTTAGASGLGYVVGVLPVVYDWQDDPEWGDDPGEKRALVYIFFATLFLGLAMLILWQFANSYP